MIYPHTLNPEMSLVYPHGETRMVCILEVFFSMEKFAVSVSLLLLLWAPYQFHG